MRLNLPEIARAYRYTPPEPMVQTQPPFDFGEEALNVRKVLEGFFSSSDFTPEFGALVGAQFRKEKRTQRLLVGLNRFQAGGTELFLINALFQNSPFFAEMAEFSCGPISKNTWANVHRKTEISERGRGIATTFQEWVEVAARSRAYALQNPIVLTADPYQLDVVGFFLAKGFEPDDPSLLQRIVAGLDDDLTLGFHDESDGRRDWCIFSGDDPLRVSLAKTIGVPSSLDELRALNKTA